MNKYIKWIYDIPLKDWYKIIAILIAIAFFIAYVKHDRFYFIRASEYMIKCDRISGECSLDKIDTTELQKKIKE